MRRDCSCIAYDTRSPIPDVQQCRENLIRAAGYQKAVQAYFAVEKISHGQSYQQAFHLFSRKESLASGVPASHLVCGSGHFRDDARLGVLGSYPTFRTESPDNGVCADPSNPCMRMLLEKGLNTSDGLIDMWDIWHRRLWTDNRRNLPRGKEIWWEASSEVKNLHDAHARKSLLLSNPLILLAVGRSAQGWIARQAQEKRSLTIDNVNVHIYFRNNVVERLVVDCPHPENMFYVHAPLYGRLMDAAINFAVALAGLNVLQIRLDYFSLKAEHMEQARLSNEGQWHLSGEQSRVVTVARMRRFEKEHNTTIKFEEIPELITWCYAKRLSINHTSSVLQKSLNQNQTLCEAILKSYASASHAVMERQQWPNLKKALRIQEAGGWQFIRRLSERRIALVQDLSSRIHISCPKCPARFWSRQGRYEHLRVVHGGFRYTCDKNNCWKTYRSNSGFAKHIRSHVRGKV